MNIFELDTVLRKAPQLVESSGGRNTTVDAIKKFLPFVKKELGLDKLPKIKLLTDPETTSFGTFNQDTQQIQIVIAERHANDVLRTLAHELVHFKQHLDGQLQDHSGETGSNEENEANAMAGIIMRNYNQSNPANLK